MRLFPGGVPKSIKYDFPIVGVVDPGLAVAPVVDAIPGLGSLLGGGLGFLGNLFGGGGGPSQSQKQQQSQTQTQSQQANANAYNNLTINYPNTGPSQALGTMLAAQPYSAPQYAAPEQVAPLSFTPQQPTPEQVQAVPYSPILPSLSPGGGGSFGGMGGAVQLPQEQNVPLVPQTGYGGEGGASFLPAPAPAVAPPPYIPPNYAGGASYAPLALSPQAPVATPLSPVGGPTFLPSLGGGGGGIGLPSGPVGAPGGGGAPPTPVLPDGTPLVQPGTAGETPGATPRLFGNVEENVNAPATGTGGVPDTVTLPDGTVIPAANVSEQERATAPSPAEVAAAKSQVDKLSKQLADAKALWARANARAKGRPTTKAHSRGGPQLVAPPEAKLHVPPPPTNTPYYEPGGLPPAQDNGYQPIAADTDAYRDIVNKNRAASEAILNKADETLQKSIDQRLQNVTPQLTMAQNKAATAQAILDHAQEELARAQQPVNLPWMVWRELGYSDPLHDPAVQRMRRAISPRDKKKYDDKKAAIVAGIQANVRLKQAAVKEAAGGVREADADVDKLLELQDKIYADETKNTETNARFAINENIEADRTAAREAMLTVHNRAQDIAQQNADTKAIQGQERIDNAKARGHAIDTWRQDSLALRRQAQQLASRNADNHAVLQTAALGDQRMTKFAQLDAAAQAADNPLVAQSLTTAATAELRGFLDTRHPGIGQRIGHYLQEGQSPATIQAGLTKSNVPYDVKLFMRAYGLGPAKK